MSQRPVVSDYLAHPTIVPWQQPKAKDMLAQLSQIHAGHPRLFQRTIIALVIWSAVVGTVQNIVFTKPSSAQFVSLGGFSTLDASSGIPSAPSANPAVARVAAATILTGGPSGQLLPPGTMAPDRTYRNTYAYGQCTWYVAGRRQIPSNWGNADSWYGHAVSSGWSVGTVPAVAAIAWDGRNSHGAGSYGHVALVEQVSADGSHVYVSEMNYSGGIGSKTTRWVPSGDFKYIY